MQHVKREDGWVIVTAIAVMSLILLTGLATMKVVETQSEQSGKERTRESSFNLAEGLLYAQAATLKSNWPTKAPCGTPASGCGYVPTCSSTTPLANAVIQCPDVSGSLAGKLKIFNNQDIDGASDVTGSWRVQVRDDIGGTATTNPIYRAGTNAGNNEVDANYAACNNQVCTWDANNNRKLWVRVDATVRERTRSLVALLQLENFNIPFAQNAVVGGSIEFLNNGNKTIVDATGSQVVARCSITPSTTVATAVAIGATSIPVADTTGFTAGMRVAIDSGTSYEVVELANPAVAGTSIVVDGALTKAHAVGARVVREPQPGDTCMGWEPDQARPQLSPESSFVNDSTYANGLTPGQLAALEAGADSVWTNSCPSTLAEWSGKVFITQTPAAGCVLNPPGGGDINLPSQPGFIIVANGKIELAANGRYYGVVYVANPDNVCDTRLSFTGNITVFGGVSVDGCGKVVIGQSSGQEPSVRFDKNAFIAFSAVGAAGLVQNTWRELARGQ